LVLPSKVAEPLWQRIFGVIHGRDARATFANSISTLAEPSLARLMSPRYDTGVWLIV